MNEHLIELSDTGLKLSDNTGLITDSPGFASIADHGPVFGEKAKSRARLHPRDSFNQYWFQPNLEPLNNNNAYFRHRADMAFSQLQELTINNQGKGYIIAIPSHYNREQLSILLGLIKHCSIEVSGLVDLSLLALAKVTNSQLHKPQVYLDLQLHQSVLTHCHYSQGELIRHKVQQIPGTGLLALHDSWANMITDAFIEQCRFNPLHTGVTEQYIYNHLPGWMNQALNNNEVAIELNNKGSVYQATLHHSDFEEKASKIFSKINHELNAASDETPQLVLSEELGNLSGSQISFSDAIIIPDQGIASTGFTLAEHINTASQGNIFLTRLPISSENLEPTTNSTNKIKAPLAEKFNQATHHLLINHRSFKLPDTGEITPGLDFATEIEIPAPFSLNCNEGISISECPTDLQVNNCNAEKGQVLHIGDVISFKNHSLSIQVIEAG